MARKPLQDFHQGPGAPGQMQEEVCPLRGLSDLLALHAVNPRRYPFLLESSGESERLGQFDILCAFPGHELSLDARGVLHGQVPGEPPARGFFEALDATRVRSALHSAGELPFRGGWFVFLAYEAVTGIEPAVRLALDQKLPQAMAVRIPAAVIRNRVSGSTIAVAEQGCGFLLEAIAADAARAASLPVTLPEVPLVRELAEENPAQFLAAVSHVQAHIAAGDIYQANISRRWTTEIASGIEPWMIYARLRRANPAPFGGLALLDRTTAIISSSPERLVRVQAGCIETRPIAGTRPRMTAADREADMRASLLGNAKERAEHVMLIDLERNDLGRLCQPGSVKVDDFMSVESYAHVHHIVSGVSGTLRDDVGPGQVLRAVFPGGTITGCPKIRCMQLIGELEDSPRGIYTGTMGYLNHDGSCDFNILIRTMALSRQNLSFRAGSGIVADSVPGLELAETRAKARGMILALHN